MKTWEGKSWSEMSAEEREKIRLERQKEHGGAECAECGAEDYEDNLNEHQGRKLCDDCIPTDLLFGIVMSRLSAQ
jgi:formylmethanofuran dehydrogenase subunit E